MKFTILLTLMFLSYNLLGQKLIKNETDEFTNVGIKETSFEPIVQNLTLNCFLSVKKMDSIKYLQVIILLGMGSPHSIKQDASFYIKLIDGSIVELKNLKTETSCKGCAYTGRLSGSQAEGSKTVYILNNVATDALTRSAIKKIRIYTSKGYTESDIKEQRSEVLKNELMLIN